MGPRPTTYIRSPPETTGTYIRATPKADIDSALIDFELDADYGQTSECPVDGHSGVACNFDGQCKYGEQTCCGKTTANTICWCEDNGKTECVISDRCMFATCDTPSPTKQQSSGGWGVSKTPQPTNPPKTPKPTNPPKTPRPTVWIAPKTPRPTMDKTPRPSVWNPPKTPRPTNGEKTPRPTPIRTPRPTADKTPKPTPDRTPKPTKGEKNSATNTYQNSTTNGRQDTKANS